MNEIYGKDKLIVLLPLAGIVVTGLIRRYALKRGVLDIPNARSSHSIPTPRGGGLSFVVVFGLFVAGFGSAMGLPHGAVVGFVGAGVVVAGIGWLDDRRGLSAKLRGMVHFLAAVWNVYWLGGLPELRLGLSSLRLGSVGSVLAVTGVVWFINMYNFMDGIDGLSGSQAVLVAAAGGTLSWLVGSTSIARLSFALSLSVCGFLVWNWPPAKIFMGDVGSGFLGFAFAYLALLSEKASGVPLLAWLILMAVFIVDATLTLLRRVLSGEKWYEAHRSHVYQLATQAGYSHLQVTLVVMVINVCLALVALITLKYPPLLLPLFVAVYGVLIALHRHLYNKWSVGTTAASKRSRKQDISLT